jgi:transcriptional regulator with PAS, ATPase and Fis domain
MSKEIGNETRGVLIRNLQGETVFSSGVAAEPEVMDALSTAWTGYESAQAPTFCLLTVGSRRFSVVVFRSREAVAALVLEPGDKDLLLELMMSADFAEDVLRHFLTNPYEAFVLVDREGVIRFISDVHKRFFSLDKNASIGRHVTKVLENTRLHTVAESGTAEIGHVHSTFGKNRIVVRKPIHAVDDKVVGAIGQLMFDTPDDLRSLNAEVGRLRSEVDFYKRELRSIQNKTYGLSQIVGSSSAIQRLKENILKVARLDVPVLIAGESGTGKELVAHAIHQMSARHEKSMVTVNAAAMPATLVESELFGYEPGAFTGAGKKARKGKFEQADGGTLFFDEIGDMPVETQVKLLRVLQDGTFERLGGNGIERSDFRFISASHRDFASMIDTGAFRLDLFYRVSAVTLHIPSLRDRAEDIPELVECGLQAFAQRHGVDRKHVTREALDFLKSRPWPGNVRQLMHAVEHAAIFSESDEIVAETFRSLTRAPGVGQSGKSGEPPVPATVREVQSRVEEELIRKNMERYAGNKRRVAAELGISRSYLYKRLAEMGLK